MNSPTDPDTKLCHRCSEVKPLTEFHRNKATRDGRLSICKACVKVYNSARREQRAEATRKWRRAHPDRDRTASALWRAAHPHYAREYYVAHRVEIRAKDKARRAAKAAAQREQAQREQEGGNQ